MSPQESQCLLRISLVPGFAVRSNGRRREFGTMASKLLAFLTLQREPTERSVVAATLWPYVRDARAAANLRTVLWRIRQLDNDLIVLTASRLGLLPSAEVDYRRHERLAREVLTKQPLVDLVAEFGGVEATGVKTPEDTNLRSGTQQIIQSLTGELLTNWYDDWLGLHQERWRQLRLHALDSFSIQLTEAGYYAAAVDAATAAVAAEPLRESAYRSLMMAHLAEGNVSEAVRTHERYCTLLERELGIAPSLQMYELLSQTTGTASASGARGARRLQSKAGHRRGIEPKKPSPRSTIRG